MGAHITETKRKGSKKKKKRNSLTHLKQYRQRNDPPSRIISILVSFQWSRLEKRWSRFEKNITILFRGSPGFPFVRPRGEINRSLMRRRSSPTCNPHFVQPNFSYFLFFPSFLFFPFFFFLFFFSYLPIVLVHLIPNRSRLPARRVTSVQTTRKRGPRSASSVERALVAEIECSFPVLVGIEVVNRPIRFVDPLCARSHIYWDRERFATRENSYSWLSIDGRVGGEV